MFVAYVIRNLDNGTGDLEILGCSNTPEGALDILASPIEEDNESFEDYGNWDNSKSSDYKLNDDGNREYGYQHVPYIYAK
ncbi:hypothetical protein FXE12_11875 [Lactobacillus sp. SL9-6]|nr:hypothetical protein FXE12_11875 [Lactobacillus sp. SL9-6]